MINRLSLGTAQFGQAYGISNKRGKIPKKEVFKILNFALKNKILSLDTAYSYGESEKVIGEFNKIYGESFEIVSKLPSNTSFEPWYYLNQSLKRLHLKKICGYLVHDLNIVKKKRKIINEIVDLSEKGYINRYGFSIYYPEELEYLLNQKVPFNIIQFPYSIFDRRFEKYFPLLKKNNVVIHTRSVFLQGAVFLDPDKLITSLRNFRHLLIRLNRLSKDSEISVASICLNFALSNHFIDKVIIGLDSLSNLKQNISSLKDHHDVLKLKNKLQKLQTNDNTIIVPTLWKN